MSQQQSKETQLPLTIFQLRKVLQFLQPFEIMSVISYLTKSFNKLAYDSIIWNTIGCSQKYGSPFDYYSSDSLDYTSQFLQRLENKDNLVSLDLKHLHQIGQYPSYFFQELKKFRNLETLILPQLVIDQEQLKLFSRFSMPNLKRLSLPVAQNQEMSKEIVINIVSSCFPNLEYINFPATTTFVYSHQWIKDILLKIKSLKGLGLIFSFQFSQLKEQNLFWDEQCCSKLETLDITLNTFVYNKQFISYLLSKKCLSLKNFTVNATNLNQQMEQIDCNKFAVQSLHHVKLKNFTCNLSSLSFWLSKNQQLQSIKIKSDYSQPQFYQLGSVITLQQLNNLTKLKLSCKFMQICLNKLHSLNHLKISFNNAILELYSNTSMKLKDLKLKSQCHPNVLSSQFVIQAMDLDFKSISKAVLKYVEFQLSDVELQPGKAFPQVRDFIITNLNTLKDVKLLKDLRILQIQYLQSQAYQCIEDFTEQLKLFPVLTKLIIDLSLQRKLMKSPGKINIELTGIKTLQIYDCTMVDPNIKINMPDLTHLKLVNGACKKAFSCKAPMLQRIELVFFHNWQKFQINNGIENTNGYSLLMRSCDVDIRYCRNIKNLCIYNLHNHFILYKDIVSKLN